MPTIDTTTPRLIKTAPRNGDWILAWLPTPEGGEWSIVHWCHRAKEWQTEGPSPDDVYPSLWLPLPPAPVE